MLVLALGAAAPSAGAGDIAAGPAQQAGLMWNRSGLPAVFPLQVKTPPGQDYFLTLTDEESGAAVLAAYIEGGVFFKVLVPPGTFRLSFAAGDVWQGEEDLFGPGAKTDLFELRQPLAFGTRGLGIKAGHVVSLPERRPGEIAQVGLKDQLICQSVGIEFPSSFYWEWDMEEAAGVRLRDPLRLPAGPGRAMVMEDRYFDGSRLRTDLRRFLSMPRYDVRSQYCG
jgi:hypothetical protein